MTRPASGPLSVAAWLLALLFLAQALIAAANVHLDEEPNDEREVLLESMESRLLNDAYMNQLVTRMKALRAAEALGLAQKRGGNVDFGLGRDISAIMAAKHRMGIAAVNDVYGPGRRRRSIPLRKH